MLLCRVFCSFLVKLVVFCEWKDRLGLLSWVLDGLGRLMWYCVGMVFFLKCGKIGIIVVELMCRFVLCGGYYLN